MNRFLLTLSFMVSGLFLFGQGSTTSAMNGRITDQNGEALIGATVVAVYTPTGAEYGNITDIDGYYRIPNMKVGGPYTVTISYVGFETQMKENIFLTLDNLTN